MSVPVPAEKIFSIGDLPVTNSMINAWVAVAVFVCLGAVLRKSVSGKPGRLQNAMEALFEFMMTYMDQVTGDRAKTRKFFPLVGTLFLFILVSNWMGLLPGVGTFGLREGNELIPMFRPATSDLNMTLAMSMTVVLSTHVIGMFTVGFFGHWGKFIQIGKIWTAIGRLPKIRPIDGIIGLFEAFIELGVGLIELVSEVAKAISLSLRLFGNIFAGEVLLHVISSIIAFGVPIPFMAMEMIVGVVQALVFSMLTLVYLTVLTTAPHGSGDEHDNTAGERRAGQEAGAAL